MKKPETTQELFKEFFKDKDPEIVRKTSMQIDRPEVYAYEIKIGKKLIEMNVDELFEMILSFNDNRKSEQNGYSINYNSYFQIASMYRSLFNFYIDNYEVIRNPFNDKRMRGTEAAKRLSQGKESYTWERIEEIIQMVHDEYEENKAKYIECIMLLYYNGFAKAEEIVGLKEDMIDYKNKTVLLPGRTIQLSDRCFDLLRFVHGLTSLGGWRGDFSVVAWRDNYFKYIIRPKEVDYFNDRPIGEVANIINRRILVDVKKKFGVEINYRILYLLGFYNYMVKEKGVDRTKELIQAVRSPAETEDLVKLAREYGVVAENVTHLKRIMRPFI